MPTLCRRFQPLGRKQRLDRGAIGLSGPAAEILDEELTHSLHYTGGSACGSAAGSNWTMTSLRFNCPHAA